MLTHCNVQFAYESKIMTDLEFLKFALEVLVGKALHVSWDAQREILKDLPPGFADAQCVCMQEAANAAELKRIIEGLPLETSAVAAVEWRLVQLDPPSFAALLTELARDNHAFRYTAAAIDSNFFLPSMDLVQVSTALANDHRIAFGKGFSNTPG